MLKSMLKPVTRVKKKKKLRVSGGEDRLVRGRRGHDVPLLVVPGGGFRVLSFEFEVVGLGLRIRGLGSRV